MCSEVFDHIRNSYIPLGKIKVSNAQILHLQWYIAMKLVSAQFLPYSHDEHFQLFPRLTKIFGPASVQESRCSFNNIHQLESTNLLQRWVFSPWRRWNLENFFDHSFKPYLYEPISKLQLEISIGSYP